MNHEDQMHPQNKLEKCLHARQLHQNHLLIDPDGVMTIPLHLLSSKMVCHQILHKHKRRLFHHSKLSVVEQGRHARIVQFSSANSAANRVHIRVYMSQTQTIMWNRCWCGKLFNVCRWMFSIPPLFVSAIAAALERSLNYLETASTFWRNSLMTRSN